MTTKAPIIPSAFDNIVPIRECMKKCSLALLNYRAFLVLYDKDKDKKISFDECMAAYIDLQEGNITENQYTSIWYFYVCGCGYR